MKVIKHKDKWYLQSDTGYKEILLSTDTELQKDGIQSIPDEFVEWFVKNPSCEFVNVVPFDGYNAIKGNYFGYEIIIPKEEPRILTVEAFNKAKISYKEPKQETIEEAANIFLSNTKQEFYFKKGSLLWKYLISLIELGAKWQQERSYSEEDMKTAWDSSEQNMRFTFSSSMYRNISFEQWFEQFKKKYKI